MYAHVKPINLLKVCLQRIDLCINLSTELAAERAMLPHPLPDLYTLCATLDLKRDVGDLMMQAFETGTKRERKGKKVCIEGERVVILMIW